MSKAKQWLSECYEVVILQPHNTIMKKLLLSIVIFTIKLQFSYSQVGIGTTNPNASSALDINSSNSGLLIPRISLTSTTDVTTIPNPVRSLLVYNTASISDVVPGFYYWDTKWHLFQDSSMSNHWKIGGNAISNGNFLGTTNYQDLLLKVNNGTVAKFDKNSSITFGTNSSITTGVSNAIILGNNAAISSPYSIAIGNQTAVSGQYATAIGYQAKTSQDYAIVLGTTDTNSKVGIGTSSPDEKIHIVGNIKMVDGRQGEGNILRSDANGKASWETIDDLIIRLNPQLEKYGELFRSTNGTLTAGNDVTYGTTGPNSGVTMASTSIKVLTPGDYKVIYTVNFSRGSANGNHTFYLRKNNTKIAGSTVLKSAYNGDLDTITKLKIVTLAANDTITLYYDAGDPITLYEGTSLSVELIK